MVVIGGKYVDFLEDVLEVLDAASTLMKLTPYAIFVMVESNSNAQTILTNVESLPPLVAVKIQSREKDYLSRYQ